MAIISSAPGVGGYARRVATPAFPANDCVGETPRRMTGGDLHHH